MASSAVLSSSIFGYIAPYIKANLTHLNIYGNLAVSSGLLVSNSVRIDQLGNFYTIGNVRCSNSITFGSDQATFLRDSANGAYITNTSKRILFGTQYLSNASAVQVTHNLNLDPNLYTVSSMYNDHEDTDQFVTTMVTSKRSNTFVIKILPSNQSNSASVSWVVNELIVY
jgi:hypothetical protein